MLTLLLISIIFNATSHGTCTLHLSNSNELTIPHITKDGSIKVSSVIVVPDNYSTIQEAINAAKDGDVVYVRAGIYHSYDLKIDKGISLIALDSHATILDGGFEEGYYCGTVVIIEANNTVVKGFRIQNGGYLDACAGIRIQQNSHGNIIDDNVIISNRNRGVYLERDSSNNTILNNIILNNSNYGLELYYSSGNKLRNNTLTGNKFNFGVWGSSLKHCMQDIDQSNLVDNKPIVYLINQSNIEVSADAGYVGAINSANITVKNLIVRNNSQGILFAYTKNSTVNNVTLLSNRNGVYLFLSESNNISENVVKDSSWAGIRLGYSSNNTIIDNLIAENYQGILNHYSNSNIVYHNNFINNPYQARDYDCQNMWDNGYPSGGNYWSDYTGIDLYSGSYQNLTSSDEIGDTPYVIDDDNRDRYPLMNPWGNPWSDWKHYHNYTETINTLLYLNDLYPNIVDIFSIGKSWQNREIYCIKLTNESNTHPKPKLFFVGYHHAREPISAELPLYFAVEAATRFGTNATITNMLNYSEIYIVPALNVDAFDVVEANEWQRKNVHPYDEDDDSLLDEDPPDDEDGDGYIEYLFFDNGTHYRFIRWEGLDDDSDGSFNEDWVGGVDLNRNYGYQWNASCQSGSPYLWAEDYRGPAPFSEPETQAIRDLALQHNFKYAISFHSGAECIVYPWGYADTPTLHDSLFREIAGNLSSLVGAPYGQSGAGLYTLSGSWDDWMYGNRSAFAFTCEIYKNNSAMHYDLGPDPDTYWEGGVFEYFNPDPSCIIYVIQRWLPVFTNLTNRAITEAYDVATTNITPSKTIVGQGFSMNITITIANKGEFTETFTVMLYVNTTVIGTREVTIPNNSSTTITLTWNTTGHAYGNYTINAEAETVQGETATQDNTLKDGWILVTIPGDVNGDFRCEGKDNGFVSKAYDTRPEDPRWITNADINNDGRVEGKDVGIVAKYYDTHYP